MHVTRVDDGFDWADAGIGAGVATALLLLSAAGLAATRRQPRAVRGAATGHAPRMNRFVGTLAATVALAAGVTAEAPAAPSHKDAPSFTSWDVSTQPYQVDNQVDAEGNGDGFVCAKPLDRRPSKWPGSRPTKSTTSSTTSLDTPASGHGKTHTRLTSRSG